MGAVASPAALSQLAAGKLLVLCVVGGGRGPDRVFNMGDYITRSAGSTGLVGRRPGLWAASGRGAGRRPPASRALVMRPLHIIGRLSRTWADGPSR